MMTESVRSAAWPQRAAPNATIFASSACIMARDPASVPAWMNLATALYVVHDYGGVAAALEQAIERAPGVCALLEQLAVVHLARRDFDAAWAAVQRCHELGGQIDASFLDASRDASRRSN